MLAFTMTSCDSHGLRGPRIPSSHQLLLLHSFMPNLKDARHARNTHPVIDQEKSGAQRITKKEYEKLAAFRFNLRHFLRFSEVAARSVGLTSQQHQALLAIKGFPDGKAITIGQLAEQLQVAHHTAVELVDRLMLQDLVVREVGTLDRRHVYIKLTDRGIEILESLTWAHREELRRLSRRLNSLF
jgi:DNA-binding MarR family transcriptional regulator